METQFIRLNMIPSGVIPIFNISQYDVGRMLGVYVYAGIRNVNLDNYTVTVEATRSDGTAIIVGVTTNNNVGTFEVTPVMSNLANSYKAQLVITDENSKRIASLPFIINVIRAAMNENSEAIEEDATLYQQYTDAMQGIIAEVKADLVDEATTRQNEDNTLQSNINAEAVARQNAITQVYSALTNESNARTQSDATINARIDNIIAPSGSAPSAAEITDARVGANGTTYNDLGTAIRTQVGNLNSIINQISKTATYDLIGVEADNIKTGNPNASSFVYYSNPVIPKDRTYLISARLNSSVGGNWALAALKQYAAGYVNSNIKQKTLVASTDAIINAIYTPTEKFCVGFINYTGAKANVEIELYVYDITGIDTANIDLDNTLYTRGFAVTSLNENDIYAKINTLDDVVNEDNSKIEKTIISDIVASKCENESEFSINATAFTKNYEDVVLQKDRKYLISMKVKPNARGVFYVATVATGASGYDSSDLISSEILADEEHIFNVTRIPTKNCFVTLLHNQSETITGTMELYVYDVTDIDIDGQNLSDILYQNGLVNVANIAHTANIANVASKANVADKSDAIKNTFFTNEVVGSGKYYYSTNFKEWSTQRTHLYILDNINGLTSNGDIGFMNTSGSWAGHLYTHNTVDVNGSTYYYVAGAAPVGAASGKPAYLVASNQAEIDINVLIVDVTGLTVTSELVEYIIARQHDDIAYIELLNELFIVSNLVSKNNLLNKWEGKNILFIGDSLTAALKYQNTVKNNLGINIYNHCKGGMGIIECVDGENGAPPFDPNDYNAGTLYALQAQDVENKDLIVFYAGYNDRGRADGEVGDCYDPNDSSQGRTIAGYMQYAINRIYEELTNANNLTCKILIVTVDCAGKYPWINADGYEQYPPNSGRTMETLANTQKAVAEANSIPCLDLWHNSGINRNTWTVYGANPNAYIENPSESSAPYPHNGDQLHKSNAGYKLIGDCITGAIIQHWGN